MSKLSLRQAKATSKSEAQSGLHAGLSDPKTELASVALQVRLV